jgi:hypothetical protein
MSEAQLKKILAENEVLRVQVDRLPKVIKTSEASKEYVKNHSDFLIIIGYFGEANTL